MSPDKLSPLSHAVIAGCLSVMIWTLVLNLPAKSKPERQVVVHWSIGEYSGHGKQVRESEAKAWLEYLEQDHKIHYWLEYNDEKSQN